MQKYTRQLLKNRFVRSVTILAGGTALGQALLILSSPVVTRLYSPDDFGVLAVYTSLLGITGAVAALKYEFAIPLPAEDASARRIVLLSLLLITVSSLLLGVVVLLAGTSLVRFLRVPQLETYLWLLPPGVLLLGSYQTFNYWAVRKKAFQTIARTKLQQSAASVAAQLGFGFTGIAPLGLLVAQVVGQTVGAGALLKLFLQGATLRGVTLQGATLQGVTSGQTKLKQLTATARTYHRFPVYSAPAALINTLGLQLPALLFSSLYGLEVAGFYALSQKLVGVPMVIVASSITQVYIAELSSRLSDTRAPLLPFFLKTLKNIAAVAALIMLLIAVALPLFPAIFGERWSRASLYTALLLPLFFTRFLSGTVVSSLEILQLNQLRLWREMIVLLLMLATLYLARLFSNSDLVAVMSLSLAGVLAYSLTLLMVTRVIRQRDRAAFS